MNDPQPHQKSAVRVAHMALNHLRTFRLLPCDPRLMDLAELEALGRALLDHAEGLVPPHKQAAPDAPAGGVGAAAGAHEKKSPGRGKNGSRRFRL